MISSEQQVFSYNVVKNLLGLLSLLFSAFRVIYKSCRQALTHINNLQCLLSLRIFDNATLVAFHKKIKQRNYINWFLPLRENESGHDLNSLHAEMKMIVAKHSPLTDNAKLQHFEAAA